MAGWADFLALVVTVSLCGGLVYGIVLASQALSDSMTATKEKLKERGLNISKGGVSVKTDKAYSREDYVDATQRGFIKAMENSSFGRPAPFNADSPGANSSPNMKRTASGSSVNTASSEEKKKKRSLFSRKKEHAE